MARDISARKSSVRPRRDNFWRQIVLQIVAANDYARTTLYIICQDFFALFSLPQNSSISHPPSSPFSTLTPFTFSFHPIFRSLRAANFSQSHPRFPLFMSNLRLLLPRAFLLLRGIFLSVRLASRHAFPSHKLLVSRATLHRDARHPVAAVCSCRAVVIFGRVEQRASVLGIRQMLLWFFAPPRRLRSSFATLLFSTSVSHVCAFRVHGYLECTPCPEALRTAVCRDIFVYAGKLDNSMRYALWSLCFCTLSCCNLLSFTMKFCFSIVSLRERQRFL